MAFVIFFQVSSVRLFKFSVIKEIITTFQLSVSLTLSKKFICSEISLFKFPNSKGER